MSLIEPASGGMISGSLLVVPKLYSASAGGKLWNSTRRFFFLNVDNGSVLAETSRLATSESSVATLTLSGSEGEVECPCPLNILEVISEPCGLSDGYNNSFLKRLEKAIFPYLIQEDRSCLLPWCVTFARWRIREAFQGFSLIHLSLLACFLNVASSR